MVFKIGIRDMDFGRGERGARGGSLGLGREGRDCQNSEKGEERVGVRCWPDYMGFGGDHLLALEKITKSKKIQTEP